MDSEKFKEIDRKIHADEKIALLLDHYLWSEHEDITECEKCQHIYVLTRVIESYFSLIGKQVLEDFPEKIKEKYPFIFGKGATENDQTN